MRAAALLVAIAACAGVTGDPGYDAELQVVGAQFRPGAFPAPTGGPATQSVVALLGHVEVGLVRNKFSAVMAPDATGAIIGIAGVDGAWIVPAGPPDFTAPEFPIASGTFGLAADMPVGAFDLIVAATDASGRIGVPAAVTIVADAAPPPDGKLVVSLQWDGAADLDLRVVDPLAHEAWADHPSTYVAPMGQPPDPSGFLTGGLLDRDKNAGCARDNTDGEDVIWIDRTGPSGPVSVVIPPGVYTVRVDTHSLCGDAGASWLVSAYANGALIGSARGVSTPEDTLYDHRAGAGITALTFQQ